jgi:nucleoside 2-deoxyribosyltransferase
MLEEIGYEVMDPWKLTPSALIDEVVVMPYGETRRVAWEKLNQTLGENNSQAIREAHAMFAVLDGPDVDSGTAAKVGYAAALGKPVIGYRGDFRLSADNEGTTVNLQVQHFIRSSGGCVVTSLAEAENQAFGAFRRTDHPQIGSRCLDTYRPQGSSFVHLSGCSSLCFLACRQIGM